MGVEWQAVQEGESSWLLLCNGKGVSVGLGSLDEVFQAVRDESGPGVEVEVIPLDEKEAIFFDFS